MTPKFRIYDKQEERYCEDHDSNWLLSMNGMIYNRKIDEWYNWIGRFEVEFMVAESTTGSRLYEGDVVVASYGYGYPNPEVIQMDKFMYSFTECLISDDIRIIGTLHDEKYKGL